MKSMTGFGRAEVEAPFGKIVTEIQSVNRKYFEVNVHLPRDFSRFENSVRKQIGEVVARGSLTVRIHLLPNTSTIENLLPDVEILQSLKKGWEALALSLGYEKGVVNLPFLLERSAAIAQTKEIKEGDFDSFGQCIKQALLALQSMKELEGASLAKDISTRLKEIAQKVDAIEKGAPDAVHKLRQKLKERMDEILAPGVELDDRLLREIALYAERLDISEEVTRFRSHISQYLDLLKSKDSNGRKMDFLIQEMGREINTMGSKSMDANISHLVVEVKSELEKVREQIQNIE